MLTGYGKILTNIKVWNIIITSITDMCFIEKICIYLQQLYFQIFHNLRYFCFHESTLTLTQGDCVQAEKKFQRAMDIRKRYPNKRDYFFAFLCQSYGWNQGAQGKYINALK